MSLRNVWLIAQRELRAMFAQPLAYVVALVLLGLCGLIFADSLGRYQLALQDGAAVPPPSVANVLGFFLFMSLFVAPAVTMRLLAEEQRSGTLELLLTLPVRDAELVLGKYVAAGLYYAIMLSLTLIYPAMLLRFGNPDVGPLVLTYVGVALALGAMLALGVLASALAESQVVAYIIAFGLTLVLYTAALLADTLTAVPWLQAVLRGLSFQEHATRFPTGVLVAKDVVYFVGIAAVALFAAVRVVESRRWRG